MKKSLKNVSVLCVTLVLSGLHANGGQWDDIQGNRNVAVTAYSIGIDLDEFQRAGADDAVNASQTSSIGANTQAIDENSSSIDANTQAIGENAEAISRVKQQLTEQGAAISASAEAIDDLERQIRDVEAQFTEAIAALSAVDFQRPLAGKSSRVSVGSGTYRDEVAIGLSLTTVKGPVDFAVGFGVAGSQTVAKAAMGLSF